MLAPAAAQAHGASDPVATSYRAALRAVPPNLKAQVVDGDLRLWLEVPATETVTVLDYRRAPYLRFDARGVQVNENSEMYYLNLTPQAIPPVNLTPQTPPRWVQVSSGHDYEWHDGRLQDLSAQALLPGQRFLGTWQVPLTVNGRPAQITGADLYRPAPSIVWLWPIAVIVLCALAAWRIDDPRLDRRLVDSLGLTAVAASALAAAARWLHGRPGLAAVGILELTVALVLLTWFAQRIVTRRAGGWTLLAVAAAGFWFGLTLLPTLLHGYTLLAIPPFPARVVTVLCLGASAGLIPLLLRATRPKPDAGATQAATAALAALLLTGCGRSTAAPEDPAAQTLPTTLTTQARPIGVGPAFHPPATGRAIAPCTATLGPRYGVHLEVFRADRVVLLPANLGRTRGCFGAAVTVDPTGVVLIRRHTTLTLAEVLNSWGLPAALRGRVYLNGTRTTTTNPTLRRHDEVVIETGPYVQPHRTYRFPTGL